MPIVIKCGESSKLSTAAEDYPCVRRLRHRRLLTLLSLQGFEAAFASVAADTDACFAVSHLRRLVERGQWKEAIAYLCRFLPTDLHSQGLEAQVLHRFLYSHMVLAGILDGNELGDQMAATYRSYPNHGSSVGPGNIRLRSIILTALHAKQHLRASLDWNCVRRKASDTVQDLAYRTPELKNLMLKRVRSMKPHNVLALGFSSRSRCPYKKQPGWPQASALAKSYLRKRRSLLSSSPSQESQDALVDKALNMVADAVDKCLKAGKRPKLHQQHPLQPSGTEGAPVASGLQSVNIGSHATLSGAPVAPILQSMNLTRHAEMSGANVAPVPRAMFGTAPSTAYITGIPSMANADTSTRHVLSSGAPFSRMMFSSPFSQTGSGSSTPPEISGISLIPNAGANVAPVPQAMFGTAPSTANITAIPSVANADNSTRHVLSSGAPFSRMMFGSPFSQTGSGSSTPPEISGISLIPNAVSQAMFAPMAGPARNPGMLVANAGILARHARSAGVPSSQTVFGCLTNPARNSGISLTTNAGASVVPVSRNTDLISHAENFGTIMYSSGLIEGVVRD